MTRPAGSALIAIASGAGLVTGLSRFPDWWLVPAAAVVAAWLLRGEWWSMALATFAAAIVWGDRVAVTARHECPALLPLGDHSFTLTTIEPGSGAGRVRVAGCSGVIMARWPARSDLAAGLSLQVRARWLPRPGPLGKPGGLLLVNGMESAHGSPGALDRFRTAVARSTDTLYGSRAPLVDALISGRRGELDPSLRDAFAAAGIVHLLAISGFHVGLLAGWVLLVLRLLRVPRHPAEALAALTAIGYAAFLGMPAPAARAAGMLALLAWNRWRQRNVRPDALLGGSAMLVLLIDPWSVVDVGAWLSILAISGMIAATRWSDRAISAGGLTRGIAGSIGATISTAPVSALVFGRVALVGIVLNLIAVPLTALLVPALLASLLAWSIVPALARAFAVSGNLLLAALEGIARAGARAPAIGEAGAGSVPAMVPWLVLALMAWWVIHDRSTAREAGRRTLWLLTTVSWGLLLWSDGDPLAVRPGDLTLLFVDVGQGDAALIRTPGGHWVAVDAGPLSDGFDVGARVLVPLLHKYRIGRIDAFVLSHAHRDHVGGARSLFAAVPVALAIDPGERFADEAYEGWLDGLAAQGTRWHPARAGEVWRIDSVEFRVRHPPREWPHQGEDLNEDSIVLEVSYRGFRALLMGDAGKIAEGVLDDSLPPVDLLKVGHHGSRGASGEPFLAAVHPEVGIISVGHNNYGHPAPETLQRLNTAGIRIWRTDREGTTTVVTDGRQFTVRGGRTVATFEATALRAPGG